MVEKAGPIPPEVLNKMQFVRPADPLAAALQRSRKRAALARFIEKAESPTEEELEEGKRRQERLMVFRPGLGFVPLKDYPERT